MDNISARLCFLCVPATLGEAIYGITNKKILALEKLLGLLNHLIMMISSGEWVVNNEGGATTGSKHKNKTWRGKGELFFSD